MTRTVRALVIQPNGQALAEEIEASAESYNRIVGGWIEAIGPRMDFGYQWTAYLAEEGKLDRLPRNEVADTIANMLGWDGRLTGDFLVGPVIFVGPTDGEGYDTHIEPNVFAKAMSFYAANGVVVDLDG